MAGTTAIPVGSFRFPALPTACLPPLEVLFAGLDWPKVKALEARRPAAAERSRHEKRRVSFGVP